MKRALMAAAVTATLVGWVTGPPASADNRQQELRERQCRFQWLDQGKWTDREERRTALCVLQHWSVPGGWETFDRVASCESGWYRFASNGGRYLGLFQHAAAYWPSRVSHSMPDGWKVGPWQRWTNSRSQIVTTARMVHYSGSWSAWSCA